MKIMRKSPREGKVTQMVASPSTAAMDAHMMVYVWKGKEEFVNKEVLVFCRYF